MQDRSKNLPSQQPKTEAPSTPNENASAATVSFKQLNKDVALFNDVDSRNVELLAKDLQLLDANQKHLRRTVSFLLFNQRRIEEMKRENAILRALLKQVQTNQP